MANITQILQTPTFKKAVKRLHKNQKTDLDNAIKELMKEPLLGEQKKGDLSFLRVHKFKMVKQLMLLGYSYEDGTVTLELMALGSHENFYRDIKNIFWCTNTNSTSLHQKGSYRASSILALYKQKSVLSNLDNHQTYPKIFLYNTQ